MSVDISNAVSWTTALEFYFKETGEKANCLSIIHKRAESLYAYRRNFIDLPVIVISSLVGFMSVGSNQMFEGKQEQSSIALGILSLFVSVLNTVGTYFSWSKRAEGHRISSIQYGKLYRFLSIELSLPREERMSPTDLLKKVKDDYERLQEISPLVPPELIREFQVRFKDNKDVILPDELNGLHSIKIFSPSNNEIVRNSSFQSIREKVESSLSTGQRTYQDNPLRKLQNGGFHDTQGQGTETVRPIETPKGVENQGPYSCGLPINGYTLGTKYQLTKKHSRI